MSESTSLIKTVDLTRSYGEADAITHALNGITMDIPKHQFVAIMGVSGSGKSTLLHLLGLLDRPTSGQYYFDGQDTTGLSATSLARIRNEEIGFIFQSFHLLARATVLENIILPLQYSVVPASFHVQKASAALEQVGMLHRLHHRPDQLSGGEKQRCAIARALVNNPQLIFADEPTGNLDSKNGELVMNLIDQLHAAGHTIVMITHDQVAAAHSQIMYRLVDGKIAEHVVYSHPADNHG